MGTPIAWLIKEYDRLVTNSPMAIETLYDMAACANTFNDWRNVLYRSEPGSIFERTALLQMAIYAKTFGAWLSVYQESLKREDCKDVQATALDQLQKLAVYPQDATWTKSKDALTIPRWRRIFEVVCEDDEQHVERISLRRMSEQAHEGKRKRLESQPKDESSSKI